MKAWLFTILRNTWLNQCRRSRAVLSVINLENEAEICADPRADPHNQYILSEERTRVQNAIQKLPTNLREIILLRVYEELSYQEIAGILCCPTGTVMSRLSRARSQLRELLSKWLQAAGTQLGQWSAAKLSVESRLTSTEQQYTRLYAALKALPPYASTHRRIAIEQEVYSMNEKIATISKMVGQSGSGVKTIPQTQVWLERGDKRFKWKECTHMTYCFLWLSSLFLGVLVD
jgi:hypothetical protein